MSNASATDERELVLTRLIDAPRDAHDKMGFHRGWGIATDQLAALAATL